MKTVGTKHPECCYSHDLENNCTIIKWGESGYYMTDFPKGGYTDDVINDMNSKTDITPTERKAMEICSMAAQDKPNLNWDEHYNTVLDMLKKKGEENE